MDEDRGIVDFVSGLLVGALIGAGAALLYAPRSGRATRRRLVRIAEDLGDSAGEGLSRAAEDARRIAEDARRLAGRARERIEDSGEKLGDALDKGRKRIKV